MSLPRRPSCLAAVSLLALLLAPLPAVAASIVAWDVGEMTSRSDYVVEATVLERLNEPLMDGGVQTRNVLSVTRYLKGSGPERLEVVQVGGTLDDGREVVLFGDIRLQPGARVVLFVRGSAPEVHATLLGWSAFEVTGSSADAAVTRNVEGLSLFTQTDDGQLAPTGPEHVTAPATLGELRGQVAAEVSR
jgi:hypothetical protein